jgi:NADH dehydrogenase FAD-containing subunit
MTTHGGPPGFVILGGGFAGVGAAPMLAWASDDR